MVERDDPERTFGCLVEDRRHAGQLGVAEPARLVAPRPHRVQPDDEQGLGPVHRLGRLPVPLELAPRGR